MDLIVNVAITLGLVGTVAFCFTYALGKGEEVIRSIFRLDEPMPLPRGKQEEDPPPAWDFGRRR